MSYKKNTEHEPCLPWVNHTGRVKPWLLGIHNRTAHVLTFANVMPEFKHGHRRQKGVLFLFLLCTWYFTFKWSQELRNKLHELKGSQDSISCTNVLPKPKVFLQNNGLYKLSLIKLKMCGMCTYAKHTSSGYSDFM